jgi:uncharacterized Tic20 family protein
MTETTQRTNAALTHLAGISNWIIPIPFISILLPLVLWQSFKKDSEYLDHHGKEAVNFNLSFFIYKIILLVIFIFTILATVFQSIKLADHNNPDQIMGILFSSSGFFITLFTLALIGILKLIMIIIASVRAGQGENYRYPFTMRLIK